MAKTLGISPKAWAALGTPTFFGLVIALVVYIVTGDTADPAFISSLIAGPGAGILAGGAAFTAGPGQVTGAASATGVTTEADATDMPTAP